MIQHRRIFGVRILLATLLTTIAAYGEAHAQEGGADAPALPDSVDVIALDTVRVGARIDDLIGIAATSSEGRIGATDLRARPIARVGELLETVPGMIVTQHSGEGKANQFFVRGFNLDHGTDFHTRVEGMPVNLPTHGHGQGYTDLNFLIPEFVSLLDYRLGIYHPELGDFGSAGGAEVHLVRSLERSFVNLTLGEFAFARAVGGGSARIGRGSLLVGGEARVYDGPWEREQDLRKFNGLARYSWDIGRSRFSVLGLAYGNRWNASDQIPLRAVESGQLGRFGQVDPTDGGKSERFSLSGSWHRLEGFSSQEVQLFGIYSDLDLYSNFTYFLEDPTGGDQFKQKDRRLVLGGNAKHLQEVTAFGVGHALSIGLQHRTDLIEDVGLLRTQDRVVEGIVRRDDVVETATGLFVRAESRWRPWLRSVVGMRGDAYTFDVQARRPENSGAESAAILSPKGSLVIAPSQTTEVYLSAGFGFHSNDARGTTIAVDPVTGAPADRVDPLVRSRGGEIGLRVTPLPAFRSTLTAWALTLESELLFVGDAGATEPSDGSTRTGITWANFWRPLPELSLDADFSLARARLDDVPTGSNRIPGALEHVFAGGIAWSPGDGLFGSLRVRHFGDYPLVEDDSRRADAATLVNGEAGYRLPSGARLQVVLLNIFDAQASDIEYFYSSRLAGEPEGGVEDVHFHPVEPRLVRVSLNWTF